MRLIMGGLAAVITASGTAWGQDAQRSEESSRYWAAGAQVGVGLEFVELEDDGIGVSDSGGYGAFGRYGVRRSRYFAWEGELGFASFGGDGTLVAGGAYAVGTLPLGPVDLRGRAGVAVTGIESEFTDGVAVGLGLGVGAGVRIAEDQSIRLDATASPTVLDDANEGVAVLLQLGYERRF